MSALPTNSRTSLRDIAKSLGVSHSTVSLALRGHSRISEAMRKKVQQKAEELGYEPDPMLTALASYRKNRQEVPVRTAIAWINAWKHPQQLRSYHEFDCYWKGASAAARKFGYHLEEFILDGELSPERLESILHARNITAILIPPHQASPDWNGFCWERFSTVRFGWSIKTPQVHLVTSDQAGNTLLALDKIREKGYKRIGFAYGRWGSRNAMFQAGFLMGQAEMDPDECIPILHLSESQLNDNTERLAIWFKKYRPDAILTDHAQLPGMLHSLGYKVPDDVGLAALSVLDGNIDAGIDQNPEEIGRVAFLMALTLINDNARGIPPIFRQTLVSGKWLDGHCLPTCR